MAKDDLERQEQEESDQLAAMHADTEEEIFKFGSDQQEDENDGDKSLEKMDDPTGIEDTDENSEQEDGPDETEDAVDGEPEEEAGEQRDEPDERGVPSWRLREETQRREQIERELSELRLRVDAQSIRPVQPPPQQPAEPDMFADPQAYTRHIIERTKQEALRDFRNEYSQRSYTAARAQNQAEFDYAYSIAQSRRDDPAFQRDLANIESSHNPGEAFMRWAEPHLAEFRQSEAQRAADLLGVSLEDIERLRDGGQRRSNLQRQNVPSLNSATRGGNGRQRPESNGMDGSERAIFDSVFQR